MSEQTAAVQAAPTHHYILTVLFPDGAMKNFSDAFTPTPGTTRAQVFDALTAAIREQRGADRMVVTFFSLEPNEISGGAR
jgi:hypothetical protein